ncbi:MAG: AbrB/MazE/SpoVT family DNA-binding domain-containing protein [Betaproteobacteria bacterium]|nr:AbrB/MazE/SpoVT family DNA-binding domain-containing protein [Betaproteobacteria bacterium]
MAESTITSKGQTTVPADIRALVHAKPGTRLVWSVMPDGTIIVRAKSKSILDMAGMLRAPKGKRVSVEEMNPLALRAACQHSTRTCWFATSFKTTADSSPPPGA